MSEPKFDPDLSKEHPTNQEAAKVRNLRYSKRHRAYVDEDGCPRRDKFGQPL
jgi:hypothetical protein